MAPTVPFPATSVELSRNVVVVDTNVLVALFDPKEQPRHEVAEIFVGEEDFVFVVPAAVIVEAWAVLIRRRHHSYGVNLLAWLNTPGTATVLPEPGVPVSSLLDIMDVRPVDVVDAMVLRTARRITDEGDFNPPVPIATFDTRDFLPLRTSGAGFRVYDMNTFEVI